MLDHACLAAEVPHSDYAETGSILGPDIGTTVLVTCDTGYSGGGVVTCTEAIFNVQDVNCTGTMSHKVFLLS